MTFTVVALHKLVVWASSLLLVSITLFASRFALEIWTTLCLSYFGDVLSFGDVILGLQYYMLSL